MSDKQVQLSGKCVLKIDTIKGSSTIEIPKVNLSGKNNADALLNEVFHFGVMRHGKNKLREMLEEKLDGYGEEYENHGLTYDLPAPAGFLSAIPQLIPTSERELCQPAAIHRPLKH